MVYVLRFTDGAPNAGDTLTANVSAGRFKQDARPLPPSTSKPAAPKVAEQEDLFG